MTERRIPKKHYIKLYKGMFTDVKKIITTLYTTEKPADVSDTFLTSISVKNRDHDVYVYRDIGYSYSLYQPSIEYRQYFMDSLGGL